jgi:hypothetical protein
MFNRISRHIDTGMTTATDTSINTVQLSQNTTSPALNVVAVGANSATYNWSGIFHITSSMQTNS